MTGAGGPANLDTGTGSINYQGDPQGECDFHTGAGSITLRLPANLNAQVDLETGVGTINVQHEVSGKVTKRDVEGTIGTGGRTSIRAHTGTGSIDLIED